MLTVETVDSTSAVDAAEWDALVDTCAASVFYRYRVLSAYERSGLGSQHGQAYVLGRNADGELVAGLPLYLLDAREILGILGIEATTGTQSAVISHFPHCYDSTVLLANGPGTDLSAVWSAVTEYGRRSGAALCGLLNVPADAGIAERLREMAGTAVSGAPRWYLDTANVADTDDVLRTMSRSTRKTLRRNVNRALADGAHVERCYGAGVEDAVALCAATAAKHGNGYYPPKAMRSFLTGLGDQFIVLRVRHRDRTLAASVCLRDGATLHTWAGGARYPDDTKWSPNYVLFHQELELAFSLGVSRLECGRRNDDFKSRHRLVRRELEAFLWDI